MSYMDYREILKTKPHNAHHLGRYIKFLDACDVRVPPENEILEKHHRCPKGHGMFLEYKNLQTYPWNGIMLTVREHIIAHVLLWKAFPNSYSVSMGLECMLGSFVEGNFIWYERKVPTASRIRYLARVRQERGRLSEGFATYKDLAGKHYYLKSDSPLIEELGLVGAVSGRTHDAKALAKMRGRTLTDAQKQNVSESQMGMRHFYNVHTLKTTRAKEAPSSDWKNGRKPPRVKTKTVKTTKQVYRVSESNAGTKWYNNGVEERRLKEPLDGWKLGKLRRSDDSYKAQGRAGLKYFNNGIENRKFETPPDASWKPGMKPRNQ